MANTNNPKGFKFIRAENGTGAAPTRLVELGSGVGVKVGDMIYLASGMGALTLTTQASWGLAIQEITAVTGVHQNCLVIPFVPGLVFQGQFLGTTAKTTKALALGTTRKVSGASGAMGICSTTAAGGIVRIVDLAPLSGNAWGTYAVCEFIITRSQYCGVA
jgi:hypothetical protein